MTIKLYSTSTCPFCKMERAFLNEKGVKYEDILLDHDHKAAEEMYKLSGQLGVPFTVITMDDGTEEKVLGFDKDRLENLLN